MPAVRFLCLTVLATACSLPAVQVETPKPIAIDINMRVDVYQHDGKDGDAGGASAVGTSVADIEARRRARMAEVQTLKNSRLVGENHEGLLSVRDLPPGDYGAYVKKTVEAENADRMALMEATANKEQKPLSEVQQSIADLWRERSFPGEWIEVRDAGGAWTWVQKAGDETPNS